jgi:predicted RecB family nuclease
MLSTVHFGPITKRETSLSNFTLLPTDSATSRFTVGCAHREVNFRNPNFDDLPRRAPDDQQQMRFDEGNLYEESIFDVLCRTHKVVNNRNFDDPVASTRAAMERGDVVIVGAELPTINHRAGRPDVLFRHGDERLPNGKWAYLPIDVKNSQPFEGKRKARQWPVSSLESPWLSTAVLTDIGEGKPKDEHSLQLAHYWLMLTDLGHIPDIEPIGAIIDVNQRVVWRLLDDGKDSVLQQSLSEWDARWAAILAMRNGESALTRPVYREECKSCPWHDVCEEALIEEQHVSLVEGVGVVAVSKLAEFGIETIPQLAALEHRLIGTDQFPDYSALAKNIDSARVFLHGGLYPFTRRGQSRPHVMRADVEVDFDVENDDVLYLLGNYVTRKQDDGTYDQGEYISFHYFDRTLPHEEGRQLALFWSWLHQLVADTHAAGKTIAVYCYSGGFAEIPRMKEASARNSDVAGVPSEQQIAELAEQPWWVDLHTIVKQLHWPTRRMGLKDVAKLAGFSWDAADAGGGNSIVWYRAACNPLDPDSIELQHKLLQYNKDDVQATLHLRNWLTEGLEGQKWSIEPVETLPYGQ